MTFAIAQQAPDAASASTSEGRLARLPALDGLRGLAVAAVVLYHDSVGRATDRWVPGGFLGVDVFFVLSGFLITGILLTNRERTGRTATKHFWVRRARRLLPALLVMLLFCSAWGALAAPRWELASLRNQSFATLLYVQNWYRMFGHPGRAPLSHTWSLSIEEQWYFVWPFLLAGLLLVTRGRRRPLIAVLTLGIVGSAVAMAVYDARYGWGRAYGSTSSRAGELLLGGLLAVLVRDAPPVASRRGRVALQAAAVLAVLVLVIEFATVDATGAFAYRGGCYLAAAATAVIVWAVVQPRAGVVGPALSVRAIAAIGLASYGVYLFHVPLFRWMSPDATGLAPLPLLALRLVVLGAMACASYRFIEMPIRDGYLGRREGVAAVLATVITVGTLLVVTRNAAAEPAWVFQRDLITAAANALPPETTRVLVAGELDAFDLSARTQRLIHRDVPGTASAVVATIGCNLVGDRPVIDGRALAPIACDDWRDAFRAGADALEPDVAVLMAGQAELFDQRVDGRTLRVGTPEYERVLRHRLDAARAAIASRGTRVLLATVPCPATTAKAPGRTQLRDPARLEWINDVWRRYASDHASAVTLIDIRPLLCPAGDAFPVGVAGPVRDPQGRLTRVGATALWNLLVRDALAARSAAPEQVR